MQWKDKSHRLNKFLVIKVPVNVGGKGATDSVFKWT